MTTEIEKELYERYGAKIEYQYHIEGVNAFGGKFTETISSKDKFKKDAWRWKTKEYRYDRKVIEVIKVYPPITPEKVLKLIALLNKTLVRGLGPCSLVFGETVEDVKISVLKDIITFYSVMTAQERAEVKKILEGK